MKRSSRIAFVALLLAACAGHSPEVRMVGSPDVPAAEGVVRATPGEHGNTQLRIFVRHLAKPEKVRPDATTYVVWLQPPGEPPQNMGALQVDADLRGSLATVTPLRNFDIFITLEPSATVRVPSARNVLSASISR